MRSKTSNVNTFELKLKWKHEYKTFCRNDNLDATALSTEGHKYTWRGGRCSIEI